MLSNLRQLNVPWRKGSAQVRSLAGPAGEALPARLWQHQGANPDSPLASLKFVVIDTETTGMQPHKGDEVISMAAVIVDGDGIHHSNGFYRLVDPQRPIPAEISALTGITQEQVAGQANLGQILIDLLDFARGGVLVGHVIQFDLQFLRLYLKRLTGHCPRISCLDTMSMAQVLYPNLRSYTLESLCREFQVPAGPRHHAWHDAMAAAELLRLFVAELQRRNLHTLAAVHRYINWQERFGLTAALGTR